MTNEEHIQDLIAQFTDLGHLDKIALDRLRQLAKMRVRKIFGEQSKYLTDLQQAFRCFSTYPLGQEMSPNEMWEEAKPRMLDLLQVMLEELTDFSSPKETQTTEEHVALPSNQVFVVHGHNEPLKTDVARLLSQIGLAPVVLHEQADEGRTVIEKFEKHSDVSHAVVLLTADDEGRKLDSEEKLKPRARQNVVFELGFFVAKLGRQHVSVLYEEGVDIPSDYSGVVYIPVGAGGNWRSKLLKELRAAGIDFDDKAALEAL